MNAIDIIAIALYFANSINLSNNNDRNTQNISLYVAAVTISFAKLYMNLGMIDKFRRLSYSITHICTDSNTVIFCCLCLMFMVFYANITYVTKFFDLYPIYPETQKKHFGYYF